MLFFSNSQSAAALNLTSESNSGEYLMQGMNPQQTSWDKQNFSIFMHLKQANTSPFEQYLNSGIILNGSLFVTSQEGNIIKLNAADISKSEQLNLGEFPLLSPITAGNNLIIIAPNGPIYKLTQELEILDIFNTQDSFLAPPIASSSHIYAASESGIIYQLELSNLSNITAIFDAQSSIPAQMAAAGNFVYAGTEAGTIFQLNAENISEVVEQYYCPEAITSSILVYQGQVFAGSTDGFIYQFNAENISKIMGSFYAGFPVYSVPSAFDGKLFYGNINGEIYALNASNISEIMETQSFGSPFTSSPSIYRDYAYFSSPDGNIFMINTSNMNQISSAFISEADYSRILAANSYIYIVSSDSIYQRSAENLSAENIDIFPPVISLSDTDEILHRRDFQAHISIDDESAISEWIFFLYNSSDHCISVIADNTTDRLLSIYSIADGKYSYSIDATDIKGNKAVMATGEFSVSIHEPEDSEWLMFRNNLKRTGHTNSSFQRASGLNQANYSMKSYVKSSPAIAFGMAFIGTESGILEIFNATNISQKIYEINVHSPILSSPCISKEGIYVATSGGHLYQFSPKDFSEMAQFYSGSAMDSSPTLANGYVYIGNENGTMYQLSSFNVSHKTAEFQTGGPILSSPAVRGDFLYIGSVDGKIYQLNASNINQFIASYETQGWISSSPSISGDSLYIGSDNGFIYQLLAENVSTMLSSAYLETSTGSTFAISEEHIFFGANDGTFYMAQTESLNQSIARYYAGADIVSSPAVHAGFVYVGTTEGKLLQFNISDFSSPVYVFRGTSAFHSSPAVANGYVYIASSDGTLYQLLASDISRTDLDIIAPDITFVNPTNENDELISNSQILVNVTANDLSPGIANLSIYVYNSSFNLVNFLISEINQAFANFSNMKDGIYYFEGTACDYDYNCNSTEQRKVIIDKTAPLVNINFSLEGSNFGSKLEVNVSIFDLNFLNLTVLLYDESGNIVKIENADVQNVTVNLSNLPEGTYNLIVDACDSEGRCNISSSSIIIDNTLPELQIELADETAIENKSENPLNSSEDVIHIVANDSTLKSINISLFKNGQTIKNEFVANKEAYLSFAELPDGIYVLDAWACDMSGNCRNMRVWIKIFNEKITFSDEPLSELTKTTTNNDHDDENSYEIVNASNTTNNIDKKENNAQNYGSQNNDKELAHLPFGDAHGEMKQANTKFWNSNHVYMKSFLNLLANKANQDNNNISALLSIIKIASPTIILHWLCLI